MRNVPNAASIPARKKAAFATRSAKAAEKGRTLLKDVTNRRQQRRQSRRYM
jgi:hypothetical protein